MLVKFFIRLYSWLSLRKKLMTLMLLVLCAAVVYCALQIDFKEDISDFLPQKSNYSKVSKFVQNAAGNSRIFIFFAPKDTVFNEDLVAKRMEGFVNFVKQNDESQLFNNLTSHADESTIARMSKFVQSNIPLFINENDYQFAVDSCLTAEHISKAFETDKTILQSPVPGYIKNVVATDPLGLFVRTLNDLKNFKPAGNYSVTNGHIFEPEMHRGIVFYDSPAGMSESNINAKIVNILSQAISEFEKENNDIEISLFGPPVIAVCNAAQIKRDSLLTSVFSIVLILVILWFSIKNIRNLLVMGLTLTFGFAAAAAAAWICFGEISIIALGISAVFTGIAANYPLHFITHLYHCSNMKQNLQEIVSPLVTGNITTVAAFLALMFADSPALRDLGFVGGVLLTASILFTLVFAPHLVKKVDIKPRAGKAWINVNFDFLQKKYVIIPVLVITPVLIWLGTKTEFDGNMSNLNYMTPPLRAEAQHTFGMMNSDSAVSVYVVTTGSTINQALENYEKAMPVADSLLRQNTISKISGIGQFIPSEKLQRERINRWNSFTTHYGGSITNIIDQESVNHKISKNSFRLAHKLLTDTFETKPYNFFSEIVQSGAGGYITIDSSEAAVVTILRAKPELAEAAAESFNHLGDDITAYDEKIVSRTLTSSLSDNFNFVLFSAGFIVFVFLTISFGRAELSLISFIPLTVSWFWILGIMYIFGINFNIVNIILATFIFGQGDDYTVFITEGLIYEHSRGKKVLASFKNSVAISSLIMFVGIGSLIFAQHPAMKSLGVVVVIGMFSVVAAAYIFPPLLYNFLVKERHGNKRQFPYTFRSLFGSLYYFIKFLIICMLMRIYTLFVRNREKIHNQMYRYVQMIYRAPRVKLEVINRSGENFEKPALIIANHQSSFDILAIKSLSPKILFLTNDSQQRNIFYGNLLKKADFYPSSLGYDILAEKFKPLVNEGFSIVVFPEGTRSEDGKIHRFHQGAFYLAQKLGLDIVPLVLHGFENVFKKGDIIMRPGKMHLEICKRATSGSHLFGANNLETAKNFRHFILDNMQNIRREFEKTDYFLPLVLHNYIYKGSEIMLAVKNELKQDLTFIDNFQGEKKEFANCGYGAVALLFALVNPDVEVTATDPDPDKILVAGNCVSVPPNLKYSTL